MAGGIWEALGAALQSGNRTYQGLKADENDRLAQDQELARRQKQQDIENAFRQQQVAQQQEQFTMQKQDRERKILESAIEHTNPSQQMNPDIIGRIQENAPELMNQITTSKAGQMQAQGGLGGGLAGGFGLMPNFVDSYTRTPTQAENNQFADREVVRDERDKKNAFRTHLQDPSHQTESFDTQTNEAFANGVNNMPMSGREFDRREGMQNAQRNKELAIMYPSDRFGPDKGGTGGNTAAKQYIAGYNMIEDNIRAQYSSQLNALARASAEGVEGADEKIALLQRQINNQTKQRATELLGPNPLEGNKPAVPDPNAAAASHGVDIDALLNDSAAEIKANPQGFIQEVNADPDLPEAAKVEIRKRIAAGGARAPQSQGQGRSFMDVLGGVTSPGQARGGDHRGNPNVSGVLQMLQGMNQPAGRSFDAVPHGHPTR
jgi:hypothetical protein